MKDYIATIVKNEKIADNVYAVTFDLGEAAKVRCGQFGNISVGGTHLLRRPIAICKVEGNTVTFCYQIKGEGTQKLKTMGYSRSFPFYANTAGKRKSPHISVIATKARFAAWKNLKKHTNSSA